MKLKYELEFMEINGDLVAVPVGEHAQEFNGIINVNAESRQILELIQKYSTPEEVHKELCALHPEDTKDEIGQQLCDFLNQLIREGLLEP